MKKKNVHCAGVHETVRRNPGDNNTRFATVGLKSCLGIIILNIKTGAASLSHVNHSISPEMDGNQNFKERFLTGGADIFLFPNLLKRELKALECSPESAKLYLAVNKGFYQNLIKKYKELSGYEKFVTETFKAAALSVGITEENIAQKNSPNGTLMLTPDNKWGHFDVTKPEFSFRTLDSHPGTLIFGRDPANKFLAMCTACRASVSITTAVLAFNTLQASLHEGRPEAIQAILPPITYTEKSWQYPDNHLLDVTLDTLQSLRQPGMDNWKTQLTKTLNTKYPELFGRNFTDSQTNLSKIHEQREENLYDLAIFQQGKMAPQREYYALSNEEVISRSAFTQQQKPVICAGVGETVRRAAGDNVRLATAHLNSCIGVVIVNTETKAASLTHLSNYFRPDDKTGKMVTFGADKHLFPKFFKREAQALAKDLSSCKVYIVHNEKEYIEIVKDDKSYAELLKSYTMELKKAAIAVGFSGDNITMLNTPNSTLLLSPEDKCGFFNPEKPHFAFYTVDCNPTVKRSKASKNNTDLAMYFAIRSGLGLANPVLAICMFTNQLEAGNQDALSAVMPVVTFDGSNWHLPDSGLVDKKMPIEKTQKEWATVVAVDLTDKYPESFGSDALNVAYFITIMLDTKRECEGEMMNFSQDFSAAQERYGDMFRSTIEASNFTKQKPLAVTL